MEIRLNVYDKGQVINSYTADVYNIMFGTVEDLLGTIDFEKIQDGTDREIVTSVAAAIPKAFEQVKQLLKDIFPGITDEELKHCRVKEIAVAIVNIIKFTIADIKGEKSKN